MAKDAFTQPEATPRKVLESFSQTTSAHGIPKIIDADSNLSTFLWASVTLVALCLFCYQGGALVYTFLQWPHTTKLDIVTRQTLQFPAVTICNTNKLRRSGLLGTIYEDLITLDGGYEDSEYSWWFDWPERFHSDNPVGTPVSNELASFPMDDNSTTVNYSSTPKTQPQSPTTGTETEAPFRRKRSITRQRSTKRTTRGDDETPQNVRLPRPAKEAALPHNDIYELFPELGRSEDFEFYDYYGFDTVEGENDWTGFLGEILKTGDFSKWLDIINPTREEVELMGHQEFDFIAQCSFDKKTCSTIDFYKFQNNLYGNCYVFNHAVNMTTPRDTGKTGAQHGLHLILFVEQPEYIGLLTQETGVRVSIHNPYSIPYPEDDGFTVPPGVSSSIGIRQAFIQRLPVPYGNCTDGANSNFSSTEFQYTRRACMKHCFQSHLQKKCGCVTDVEMEQPLCSVINSTQQICKQLAEKLFAEDLLGCVCPTPCSEYRYKKTVSSSTWPSERFKSHLVNALSENDDNIRRILGDVTLTRKNLVQLKIYFEELNYESIKQTPLYTVEGLLGGVGGLMGLYIGLSVISVFEIVVFVCRFLRASWDKMMRREKVKPFSADGRDPRAVQNFNYDHRGNGLP